MRYGYYGRILRVDLSSGALSVDEQDDLWYRRHMGGAAMSAYYLLKEMKPGADPLGPDNRFIVAPGVFTGAPVAGNARVGLGAKSPLSGGIGKSEAGGFFGAELKHAGFDGIVVEGQVAKPVYLWIKDGVAELREASHLWGRSTQETEETIRTELGEKYARVASIGPAGEKMVRFACMIHDLKSAAGRGGMGAVMGSKRLKAIVVRGKIPPQYADPAKLRAMGKDMAAAVPVKAAGEHTFGTGSGMVAYNLAGNIPTRNFREGWFENVEPITAQAIKDTIRIGMEGCYACSIRCKKVVRVEEPWIANPRYGGPEYETLGAFGCNCGGDDLKAIARAHHICQAYSMDTISAGCTVAFAMECFEKGYLSKSDLDGLELTWGNADAMLSLLEKIGMRQGIGDLLAEGTSLAARSIGKGAETLAMTAKGVDLGMHEPRLKHGLALGYAVANHGGDHGTGLMDTSYEKDGPAVTNQLRPLGILEPMPANELSTRKVNLFRQLHRWRNVADSVCYCSFVPWTYDEVVQLVNSTTGWNTTMEELMTLGERAITLGRAFNIREGFTTADDSLPARFFSPPSKGYLAERQQALNPAEFQMAIHTYYYLMGWDSVTGVPTRRTLERLEEGWVADDLDRVRGRCPSEISVPLQRGPEF